MIKFFAIVFLFGHYWMVLGAKEIDLDYFEPFADYDPNFIRYGTLRVTKKSRNLFVLSGYMESMQNMGNEILLTYELINEKGISIMKKTEPICDFCKNDKYVYPGLHKNSNLPEPGTCPILKGNYTMNNMQLDVEKFPSLAPGKHIIKAWYTSEGKKLGGYSVKITYKYV